MRVFAVMSRRITVLELFSGIGGWHVALKELSSEYDVVFDVIEAYDINENAGEVYSTNFRDTKLHQTGVQTITRVKLEKLKPDMICMSPPCQPFSRNGNFLDVDDGRNAGFGKLMKTLVDSTFKPNFIAMENVKGFEKSICRDRFVECLQTCGFRFIKEMLLTPLDYGIPNCRLRYYLVARRDPPLPLPVHLSHFNTNVQSASDCPPLSKFFRDRQMDLSPFNTDDSLIVSDADIQSKDVATLDSQKTMCFTKNYGRYAKGTGSVLRISDGTGSSAIRYFSPREVATLMDFPTNFVLPESLTRRQLYAVLGNSLNIRITVAALKALMEPAV